MSLDADAILDRRRLKRRIGLWRILAFLFAAVAGLGMIAWAGGLGSSIGYATAHIARLKIAGFIHIDRQLLETIEAVGKNRNVKGVIVVIESSGGTTSGGEAIQEAIRKLAGKKPTVAHVDTLAASAAYMIALGADQIVARRSAIIGSIGVLVQWGEVTGLMDKVGVKLQEVKSTPLKAEPTPFKPASPEAKAMLDSMVQDSYRWFVGMVAERRGLSVEEARTLADGRVVTGAQAKDLKLIDAIGGPDVAKNWLETARGVEKDLPIKDWKPSEEWLPLPEAESLAAAVTRGVLSAIGLQTVISGTGELDGLRSVWNPTIHQNMNEFPGIGQ